MASIFRSRTKAQRKEDAEILGYVETRLKAVRMSLKTRFWAGGEKRADEDMIYFLIKHIDLAVDALQGYLGDGEIAKYALEHANNGWPLNQPFARREP